MLLISVLPSGMMRAQSEKTLTILHTNDTHSCIMPLSRHLADTMQAGRGGFLRRIAMLKEERKQDPDLFALRQRRLLAGITLLYLVQG